MKSEIPSYLESLPDQLPPGPPAITRPQVLPFKQLTWENFERLCLRVARQEADIRQCFLYGTPGQEQRGIDFIGYAGDVLHRQVRVYQCKRERRFGPTKIREAVDEFLAGNWDPKPTRFVLCSILPLRATKLQEEIGRQLARLAENGVEFEPWDSEALAERLKDLPNPLGHGLHTWDQIPALVRECLRAWNRLKDTFGEGFYERFGTEPMHFWEVAAPWVDGYPHLRTEFENYLRTTAGKPAGPNMLQAMASAFPKSDELRATCLETLRSSDFSRDPTPSAARLLGQHFGGDSQTLEALRSVQGVKYGPIPLVPVTDWRKVLALCYGWPQAPEIQEWLRQAREHWKGIPWHIALHLDRVVGNATAALQDIEAILRQNPDRIEVHDDEISCALRLWVAEAQNRSLLIPWLDRPEPSAVATAVGLLSTSGSIGAELQSTLEALFEREVCGEEQPPRAGLDLSAGHLRVIAESIFDAISSVIR